MNLNAIPPGLTVEAQRVKLTRPIVTMIEGKQRSVEQLVEFRVRAKGPFPPRALDPVLMVDNHVITEYRYIHENELLFTEYQPESLPTGGVVYFQWGKHPAPGARQATSLTLVPDKLPVIIRGPNNKVE